MKTVVELILTVEYVGLPDTSIVEELVEKAREHGRVAVAKLRFTPALETVDLLEKKS